MLGKWRVIIGPPLSQHDSEKKNSSPLELTFQPKLSSAWRSTLFLSSWQGHCDDKKFIFHSLFNIFLFKEEGRHLVPHLHSVGFQSTPRSLLLTIVYSVCIQRTSLHVKKNCFSTFTLKPLPSAGSYPCISKASFKP